MNRRPHRRSVRLTMVLTCFGWAGWTGIALTLGSCSRLPIINAVTTPTPSPSQAMASPQKTTSKTPEASQKPTPKTPQSLSKVSPIPSATPLDSSQEISIGGIGLVRLGMTLADAKRAMGPNIRWQNVPNLLVDFGGIAAKSGSQTLFYIIYEASNPLKDTDSIAMLMTENSAYQTHEGIGPGTSIAEAEKVYGQATLSFNWDNEGREFVKFANQPSNMTFRTKGSPNDFDGRYATTQGQDFYSTHSYRSTAAIGAVWVTLP